MAKHGLPLERHVEIGQRLVSIREDLMDLHIALANAYGKTKPVTRAAVKAQNNVDILRCLLDSLACSIPGGGPGVYYPGNNPKHSP